MGITTLTNLVKQYVEEHKHTNKISSEICYIDFTGKICSTTERVNKIYKSNPSLFSTPLELIEYIINEVVKLLFNQINNNKFYKKIVVVFDHCTNEFVINPELNIDSSILEIFIHQLTKDSQLKATVMIPRKFIPFINIPEYFDTIKKSVRNLIEVKYNQNRTFEKVDIKDYIDLKYIESIVDKKVYDKLRTFGLLRYILTRGCKEPERKRISKGKNKAEEFNELSINEFLEKRVMNIIPPMIIGLSEYIILKLKEQLKTNVNIEFLGTTTESDFMIVKHMEMYHKNQCCTIYTTDTDFLALCCKKNTIIKYSHINPVTQEKYNVSINPRDFWNWLLGDESWSYLEIITISCLLGTSYGKQTPYHIRGIENIRNFYNMFKESKNRTPRFMFDKVYKECVKKLKDNIKYVYFLIAMCIYSQANKMESSVCYLNPKNIDLKFINERNRFLIYDLVLGNSV